MSDSWKDKLAAIKAKHSAPASVPSQAVPVSDSKDKLLECEGCPALVKVLHTIKSKNGKESRLCKTCFDASFNLPPIVPGDMSQPQTPTEQVVEADRRLANGIVEAQKYVKAESLLTEDVLSATIDRERFMEIFTNKINAFCIGKTRQEIEDCIIQDHIALFDTRAGIQAMLAYRAELLKDETAEERAKALKEDWLYKPIKTRATASPKAKAERAAKDKAPRVSPLDSMRQAMLNKGMDPAEVEKRLAAFKGME